MVISPLWLQGIIRTFVFGFAVLSYLALRLYQDHAPIPARVVSEMGQPRFTGEDILRGQEAFLTYGSVYWHGAYLGPDFTAASPPTTCTAKPWRCTRSTAEMPRRRSECNGSCRPTAMTRRPTR